MAMFKWSTGFYINPDDVVSIQMGTDSKEAHSHYMIVCLRNGKELRTNYAQASARDTDAVRLSSMVNQLKPDAATRYDVEDLLKRLRGAIQRDLRSILKKVMPDEYNEGDGR